MSVAITILGWLIFLLVLLLAVPASLSLVGRPLQRMAAECCDLAEWPLVSVIIPAREEAAKLEPALRSVLASDYPSLEVIAVDDRSRDGTAAIMHRLAAEDARLRVISITELPSGWLGKPHALARGAEAARGEYLLFTDADVHFAPSALPQAMRYGLHKQLDHLCLMPRMPAGGYWEAALVSCFGLFFAAGTQPGLVTKPMKDFYAGVGAFNLLRREAYRQAGGHEPLRLDVLDDIKLGKLIKRCRFRQDILLGGTIGWPGRQSSWKSSPNTAKRSLPAVSTTTPRRSKSSMKPAAGSFMRRPA